MIFLEDWLQMARAGLPLIPGPKMVAPGVKRRWVEEDICGKRWWVAVEVAGRFRSETFPFLSNFDGQTRVVPGSFQTHLELAEL